MHTRMTQAGDREVKNYRYEIIDYIIRVRVTELYGTDSFQDATELRTKIDLHLIHQIVLFPQYRQTYEKNDNIG